MTHSQQPSIDILKKIIASNESWAGSRQDIFGNNPLYLKAINELKLVKKEIEALPQEPTTDELLEKFPVGMILMRNGKNEWSLFSDNEWSPFSDIDNDTGIHSAKKPREVLLVLNEKLPTNQ